MPPVGFKPKIAVGERQQTYALDRAATGTRARTHARTNTHTHIYIYITAYHSTVGNELQLYMLDFGETKTAGNCTPNFL
jgi:hypothetical protein